MSSTIKSFGLSSSLKEEAMVTKMQGIGFILGTDSDRLKNCSNSLRRTLSADMSSRKWLSRHGPLKKIASSENFPVSITEYSSSSSSSSSWEGEEEDYEHDHCSNNKKSQFETENQSQFDIWSSIIQQKKLEDSSNVPAPYVHPLVRRSSSSLSEKSLQICTESLGSETGSDGFSSNTPSETSDAEEKEEQPQQEVMNVNNNDMEEVNVVKYNNLAESTKRTTLKTFPPPISSLSCHRDGTSVLMKSHRDNGRLVLEAVSVSSQNNFRAERQDGRLVLTLINGPKQDEEEEEKENDVDQFDIELEGSDDEMELENENNETYEEEEEEEEVESGGGVRSGGGEMKFVMEQAPKLSGGIINVHRLATMVDKTMILTNKNTTTWTNHAKYEEGMVTQSLPPRPPMSRMIPSASKMIAATTITKPGAVSFNPYEYYWKPKPTSPATAPKTISAAKTSRNNLSNMLYISQNCKQQRSRLLCQESYCIATS